MILTPISKVISHTSHLELEGLFPLILYYVFIILSIFWFLFLAYSFSMVTFHVESTLFEDREVRAMLEEKGMWYFLKKSPPMNMDLVVTLGGLWVNGKV